MTVHPAVRNGMLDEVTGEVVLYDADGVEPVVTFTVGTTTLEASDEDEDPVEDEKIVNYPALIVTPGALAPDGVDIYPGHKTINELVNLLTDFQALRMAMKQTPA